MSDRLVDSGWIKIDDETYEHPQLLNWKGKRCQYTVQEALTVQNGWDIGENHVN